MWLGGGDYAAGRILPDCVRAAERGEPVRVRDPRSVRPYQHVLEAVSAYLQLAAMQYEDPRLAGSYNVAPLCGTSTGELAGLFCAAWGCSWRQGGEPLPHEAAALLLEGSKLRGLGVLPRWSVRQAVEKTVEWEKARLAGRDLRAVTDAQLEEVKAEISGLTARIGELRGEVALCDGIAARSGLIRQKIQIVRQEKGQGKEEVSHEHIRRGR